MRTATFGLVYFLRGEHLNFRGDHLLCAYCVPHTWQISFHLLVLATKLAEYRPHFSCEFRFEPMSVWLYSFKKKKKILYLATPGLPWGGWDLVLWTGTNPGPLYWKQGVSATGPPWPLNSTNCKWLCGCHFSSQVRSHLGGSTGQRLSSAPWAHWP